MEFLKLMLTAASLTFKVGIPLRNCDAPSKLRPRKTRHNQTQLRSQTIKAREIKRYDGSI